MSEPITTYNGRVIMFNNGVVDVLQDGISVVDENKVAHITTSSEGNVEIDNLTIIKNAEHELEVPFDNDSIYRDSEDGFIKAKEPSDAKIILCTQVGDDPAGPVGSFTLNQGSNKTITIPIPEGGGTEYTAGDGIKIVGDEISRVILDSRKTLFPFRSYLLACDFDGDPLAGDSKCTPDPEDKNWYEGMLKTDVLLDLWHNVKPFMKLNQDEGYYQASLWRSDTPSYFDSTVQRLMLDLPDDVCEAGGQLDYLHFTIVDENYPYAPIQNGIQINSGTTLPLGEEYPAYCWIDMYVPCNWSMNITDEAILNMEDPPYIYIHIGDYTEPQSILTGVEGALSVQGSNVYLNLDHDDFSADRYKKVHLSDDVKKHLVPEFDEEDVGKTLKVDTQIRTQGLISDQTLYSPTGGSGSIIVSSSDLQQVTSVNVRSDFYVEKTLPAEWDSDLDRLYVGENLTDYIGADGDYDLSETWSDLDEGDAPNEVDIWSYKTTTEYVTAWEEASSGSSYTAGEGINISNSNVISIVKDWVKKFLENHFGFGDHFYEDGEDYTHIDRPKFWNPLWNGNPPESVRLSVGTIQDRPNAEVWKDVWKQTYELTSQSEEDLEYGGVSYTYVYECEDDGSTFEITYYSDTNRYDLEVTGETIIGFGKLSDDYLDLP